MKISIGYLSVLVVENLLKGKVGDRQWASMESCDLALQPTFHSIVPLLAGHCFLSPWGIVEEVLHQSGGVVQG